MTSGKSIRFDQPQCLHCKTGNRVPLLRIVGKIKGPHAGKAFIRVPGRTNLKCQLLIPPWNAQQEKSLQSLSEWKIKWIHLNRHVPKKGWPCWFPHGIATLNHLSSSNQTPRGPLQRVWVWVTGRGVTVGQTETPARYDLLWDLDVISHRPLSSWQMVMPSSHYQLGTFLNQ